MESLNKLRGRYDKDKFKKLHEEMSFGEYLDLCYQKPRLARDAFQIIYDMILSFGYSEYEKYRKNIKHWKFFDQNPYPIFGMDVKLDEIVQFIKGAAGGYGTDERVLLLHGPVGSSKSTIARRLKRGMEEYSRTEDGAIYTYKWVNLPEDIYTSPDCPSPMHEDPLKLIPLEDNLRNSIFQELNEVLVEQAEGTDKAVYKLKCEGQLNPRCRKFMSMLMDQYEGDWFKVVEEHIRVVRMVYSEADRKGIATFQPKDEKNQDSTELTGDIDWRLLPHFGSDSDPRAFSFDGEFCVGNRGFVEFIEMLKLQQEFLYDLLGATQENQIKPKKFSQVSIREFIMGHSVSGDEPIAYRENEGIVKWTTLENLYDVQQNDPNKKLSVIAHDFKSGKSKWTPVVQVTRHKYNGRLVKTLQKWGQIVTTPNHAIFDREGNIFMPEDCREVMAVRADTLQVPTLSEKIDISELMPKGFVCDDRSSKILGHTKLPGKNRLRSTKQRASTSIERCFVEKEKIEDLLSFLVFYATEGHSTNEGIVISQKDRTVLENLQNRISNFADIKGHIQYVEQDGCHRLIYNCYLLRDLAENLCGIGCVDKKLPDFIFNLNTYFLGFVKDLLKLTDGSEIVFENCTEEYRNNSLDYKTTSPMLAAQVGFLLTRLGLDYSLRYSKTSSGKMSYGIKTVQGNRKNVGQKLVNYESDFNGWVYDIECRDIHNFACGVGQIICHNTNNPEYEKLVNNRSMEALRDRTVKIDIPYLLKWDEEIKVLEQDYGDDKVEQHVAPHTLEVAALWAVLTRLDDDKDSKINLIQKAKLYNDEALPGYNEDAIMELKEKSPDEGMFTGVSVRYLQDKISNCLSKRDDYINPFMVLNEIKEGLDNSSLITNKEHIARYNTCVDLAIKELNEILKNEVRKALVGDEKAIERLCANYIDNLIAYNKKTKIRNKITGRDEAPNERLMRSIEEKIGIADQNADDFRMMVSSFMGELSHAGKEFKWDSNSDLKRALEAKLFEDVKDHVKLSALNVNEAATVDPEMQVKIDAIKQRLITQHGYNEKSATDVLDHVGSIFNRGETEED